MIIQESSGWRVHDWPSGRLRADGAGVLVPGPGRRWAALHDGLLKLDRGRVIATSGSVTEAVWDGPDGLLAVINGQELWHLPVIGDGRLLHGDDQLRQPQVAGDRVGFEREFASDPPGVILNPADVRRPFVVDRAGGPIEDRLPEVTGWVDWVTPSPTDPARSAFQHTDLPGPYTFRLGLLINDVPRFPLPDSDLRSYGSAPAWAPDGSVVAVSALQGIRGGIAGCDPDGAAWRWLADPEGMHTSPAPVPGGNGVLSVWQDLDVSPSVVLTTPHGRTAWASITESPDWWPSAPPRLVRWRSGPDELEGLLLTPPGPGPHPTVIDLHGGPDNMTITASLSSFAVPLDGWIEAGFAVFAPDYRASGILGFEAKRADGRLEPGTRTSADDVIAGIDQLITEGVVDPSRLHLFGCSMGGLVGGHTIARGARIRSAAFWDPALTDPRAVDNALLRRQLGGTPEEVPEAWDRIALHPLAAQTRIPVLIMSSGDPDRLNSRVHAGWQSALPQAELHSFPAEGHQPSRRARHEIIRRAVAWFHAAES
ncbi:alpha/beta hydrolase family protein [Microlunatus speluncae]|uniref:alpha/beta hydrolase family protein n=1 Tax=Microlunatus speluncae TaxID=2594267 RepID=UPI001375745B|nr:prolyl oligopeptidase family serine peptidase [Microlunatus speluncae]